MTDIDKQLDESPKKGVYFDRGFWRHPTTKAVMLKGPDGKKKARRAPSGDFKAHLDNTTNLEKWKERQVVLGVLAMLARGDRIEPTTDRHVLDALVIDAMEAAGAFEAAEQGTFSHLLTELNDEGAHWLTESEQGNDIGIATNVQAALVEAWQRLLADFDLEILAIEQTVANDLAAGTLDRIARTRSELYFERLDGSKVTIPVGTSLVLDVKTGKLRYDKKGRIQYWNGYVLQIGHYANSRPVLVDPEDPDNVQWQDWPSDVQPSTEHALIAHLDVANGLDTGVVPARIIYVDLTEYDKMVGTIDEVRYWRKQHWFSPVTDVPDACVTVEADTRETVPYGEVTKWLQARVDRLGAHQRSRKLLVKHWPQGTRAPKDGIEIEDIDAVVELVDRIEAECQMPFGTTDPRSVKTGHKDDRTIRPIAPETNNEGMNHNEQSA